MNQDNTGLILRTALERLGAREFEIVALTLDEDRGLAALNIAEARGANHPISYAIKLFDDPEWNPAGESRRASTNQSVDRSCHHCGGDRFVIVTAGLDLYDETYAPCKVCNPKADTKRWIAREPRETVPR
jgi:hypothetical protein